MNNTFERVEVLGISISNIDSNELNQAIYYVCQQDTKHIILNVNIHAMNIAFNTEWFKEMLNNALINFCDGDGVRIGARILGRNIKEKITYNRWIWEFAEFSLENNLSWYLVGSKPNVIELAVEELFIRFPTLNIIGYHHGYLRDDNVNENLISDIRLQKPDILILGMGMPVQEKWLKKHYDQLNFNVALTGGAVFEYVAGTAKMTPDIYYNLKLEWFYRFLNEPSRLFYRYFVGNPLFIFRVLLQKIGVIKF